MPILSEIVNFLDQTLQPQCFDDGALNGLQVECSDNVSSVCLAVDAALTTINLAKNSDLLITHHGLFWGPQQPISGSLGECVKTLVGNNTSLYASHLPLDAHPELGNNARLVKILGLKTGSQSFPYRGTPIGLTASNPDGKSLDELAGTLLGLDNSGLAVNTLAFGPSVPEKLGIITGSGCDALPECVKQGIDTFITGEPKQQAYHFCKDNGLNCIFGGHYRTETVGVKALGKLLEEEFNIKTNFIEHPTGI